MTALKGKDSWMPVEEQLSHMSRAIQLDPQRAVYWETRAGYRIGLHDLAGALSDLNRAISLSDRPYLRFRRGAVLCERGEFQEALRDLNRAIAEQPANLQFYRPRAMVHIALKQPTLALADAERMVAGMADVSYGYYARGLARAALGESGAVEDISYVIATRPELVAPRRARAWIYGKQGEDAKAAADLLAASKETRWGWEPCLMPWELQTGIALLETPAH